MSKIKNTYRCSLPLAIDLIGGKWKLIILWYLIDDIKRFSDLRKNIPEITQKMLTQQLRELEDSGIVNRVVYPVVPPKVEYSLTDEGRKLIPILKSLCEYANDYAVNNNITIK